MPKWVVRVCACMAFKGGQERLDSIVEHVIEGEEIVVARTNQSGITYDLLLPNDEWLGDAAAEGDGK